MKNIGFLLAFLLLGIYMPAKAQDCSIRVSLLTVSPGDELYSTFGHTAIRVTDTATNRDIVYNYGTFDFDEPGFYLKFIQGKLKYFVSADDFGSFEYGAMMENRSITEQELNLTCEQKRRLVDFLAWNMLPANKFYKYDFTFDNCTTRVADLIDSISGGTLLYKSVSHQGASFRDAIHEYLDQNNKSWDKLGIDILLGRRLDRRMTAKETLFLPEYLMNAEDSATIGASPLVESKAIVVKEKYVHSAKDNISGPMFVFACLFVIIAFLSFAQNKGIRNILSSLDGILFFLYGLIGVLLIFMWFWTDHFMTKDNYNLLWAWPTNLIAAFYVHSKKSWPRFYFLVYALAQLLLIGLWFVLPQKLNPAMIPLNGILIFRSILFYTGRKQANG